MTKHWGPLSSTGDWSVTKPTQQWAKMLRRPAGRYLLTAAILIIALAAGFAVLTNRPVTVHVAAIEENVPVRVFGLGTVEARVLSKIGFEVGATLVELAADHGDRVTKGQVLARMPVSRRPRSPRRVPPLRSPR